MELVPEVKHLSGVGLLSTLLWRELVIPTVGEFLDFDGEVGFFPDSAEFTTLLSPVTNGGDFILFFICLAVRVGLPIVFVADVVTVLHFVAMASLHFKHQLNSYQQNNNITYRCLQKFCLSIPEQTTDEKKEVVSNYHYLV